MHRRMDGKDADAPGHAFKFLQLFYVASQWRFAFNEMSNFISSASIEEVVVDWLVYRPVAESITQVNAGR